MTNQTKLPATQLQRESASKSRRRFAIVNADDFGFSSGVNRAIIEAHERGVLTSASLMVTGKAFDEAVALAQAHPNLGVGLHLVLECGKSVLPHSQIPNLVDSSGNFPSQPNRTGFRYQFDRAARREMPLEIRAQLEKFRSTGLPLSHVDGHQHMHSNPVVLRAIVALADEFNIKVIRLPSEELRLTLGIDSSDLKTKLLWYFVYTGLRLYGERLLRSKGVGFAERVYGLLESGRMTEAYLLGLVPQIQADLVEIYCHPAIATTAGQKNGQFGLAQAEFDALLSQRVREVLAASGFELTNFNNPEVIGLSCKH